MKKVYVLLAALIFSAGMLVQAAPIEKKEVSSTVTADGTQQAHRRVVHHHHRRVVHHRRHRRPHH